MTRKGYLLATVGGVAAAAATGSAQAADMPVKGPTWMPAESWTGWYIGLNAGAAWQQANNSSSYDGIVTTTNTGTGFIGGAQIGYNWQHGNGVLGLEADINGLTGQMTSNPSVAASKQFSNQIQWLSTVRARVGLAVGNTLAYATGGVAIGGVKNTLTGSFIGAPKSDTATRVGWAAGGGIEHMMGNHLTLGVEALFVDLGQTNMTTATGKTAQFSNQAVIGRVKLNYKW